jgi:hypothetical protein
MLDVLVLVAAVTSPPAPQASPSPAPVLQEIAHVRASASCAELVTHANAAIGIALGNDQLLLRTIDGLQTNKLDGNEIEHRNGLDELGNFALQLNTQAMHGDAEIKRLRAIAAKATDPQGKAELTAFANWLGGALWRQRKIARDLNGFIATMDAKDMAKPDEGQLDIYGTQDPMAPNGMTAPRLLTVNALPTTEGFPQAGPPREFGYHELTEGEMALAAARDFELRIPEINNDEAMAADHVVGATSGC